MLLSKIMHMFGSVGIALNVTPFFFSSQGKYMLLKIFHVKCCYEIDNKCQQKKGHGMREVDLPDISQCWRNLSAILTYTHALKKQAIFIILSQPKTILTNNP